MVNVEEVAENIYMIDDQVCSIPELGSVYLLDEEKKALVDSGPPSSASTVFEGIKKVGVKIEDINYIIVTHIHLDHAGGTGVLLEYMPQAQVLVHYRGAKHLVNLTRLMESAMKTQGHKILEQYGEILPVAPTRVRIINDNDTIQLSGEQALAFIDAPGHAFHELCVFERRNQGIFVGDALGLYLADGAVLIPCHPPPSFDAEAAISTIKRLMTLSASRLYFAHFGVSSRAHETLQMAIDQIQIYAAMVAATVRESGLYDITKRLSQELRPALEPLKKQPAVYKLVNEDLLPSGIKGFVNHYSRKHKN